MKKGCRNERRLCAMKTASFSVVRKTSTPVILRLAEFDDEKDVLAGRHDKEERNRFLLEM